RELGIDLKTPPASPDKPYLPTQRSGRLLFGSGNTSIDRDRDAVHGGRFGHDLATQDAEPLTRLALLNALAAMRAELGSLDRIATVVKMNGYVTSTPDFTDQAKVIDPASRLLLDLFGERGRHARAAIGVTQLPRGAAVEIELIVEVADPS
ncbi:MAG: RidA family protein, partial [Trueperaceae bacterium]